MLMDLVSLTPLGRVGICDTLVSAGLHDVARRPSRPLQNIHDFIRLMAKT